MAASLIAVVRPHGLMALQSVPEPFGAAWRCAAEAAEAFAVSATTAPRRLSRTMRETRDVSIGSPCQRAGHAAMGAARRARGGKPTPLLAAGRMAAGWRGAGRWRCGGGGPHCR